MKRLAAPLKFRHQFISQFLLYLFAGAIATAVDWFLFYLLNTCFNIDYKLAVAISFASGAAANYTLNKKITFKDKTEFIAAQISIYISLSVISLFLSVLVMFVFVNIFKFNPMPARILTTGLLVIINFLMNKFITFNKKFYA